MNKLFRKSLIAISLSFALSLNVYAAKIPDNVKNYVSKDFPKTNFRFDGVIILPDNTIYLPVIPAKVINPKELNIKATITFRQEP